MSAKRTAEREMNHENWNDEEVAVDAGEFRKASEDELQRRVRKMAKPSRVSTDLEASTTANTSSEKEAEATPATDYSLFKPSVRSISPTHSDSSSSALSSGNAGSSQGKTFNANQSQQDYASEQNYYNYNNSNQSFMMNQFGQCEDQFSQQNYSCYTPTANSLNSYITAGDPQAAHSQTTQSSSYSQKPGTASSLPSHVVHSSPMDSPQRHSNAIPTYSAAVNSTSKCSETHSTHSTQNLQQISSTDERRTSAVAESDDLLDLTMKKPTIDLNPVGVAKPPEIGDE